jgi:hypothetical protein
MGRAGGAVMTAALRGGYVSFWSNEERSDATNVSQKA